jgi:hypothetical protein
LEVITYQQLKDIGEYEETNSILSETEMANDHIMMTMLVVVMKLAWKCTAGIAAAFYRGHLLTLNSLGNNF